jgi:hypothetical protein
VSRRPLALRQQVLLSALECSGGDLHRQFTAEDLVVTAWKRNPLAWGLRGHEREHPDSEKIYKELDSRGKGDMVGLGLLEKVEPRIFKLTPAGLTAASELDPDNVGARERAQRELESAVRRLIDHPVFIQWLKDREAVSRFRDASHFWGIAPGTPARVVRDRVNSVDATLTAAFEYLEKHGIDEVSLRGGRRLFDRQDLDRLREFQNSMKERFAHDLRTLGY